MSTSLATRLKLKIRKIARELRPVDGEFWRSWPVIDSVEGWLLPSEGAWLFRAARSLPTNGNIVEIGSFKGRSTCCLALGCRGTERRVFGVDTFDGGPDLPNVNSLPDFRRNIERCGVSAYVKPIVKHSGAAAKTWREPIHLLFIDGSHSYEDVLADFAGFFPHVVPGGVVAFHDVINESWPGVGRAWADVKGQLTEIGHSDSLGFGRKPDAKVHS
jgi:predicted O-methyltransferase YrrM